MARKVGQIVRRGDRARLAHRIHRPTQVLLELVAHRVELESDGNLLSATRAASCAAAINAGMNVVTNRGFLSWRVDYIPPRPLPSTYR
jgi:hypothetical protein